MRCWLKAIAVFLVFGLGFTPVLQAQTPYKTFRVYFTDKNNNPYSLTRPLEFLSQRSVDRRQRQHLSLTEDDLPVTPAYLDSLRQAGARIIYTSRWLNAATIEINDSLFLDKLSRFSFIQRGRRVLRKTDMRPEMTEWNMLQAQEHFLGMDYGDSYPQLAMVHGEELHNKGSRGQGMYIAVLDAGFYRVDSLKAFENLRSRHGIAGTKDFIEPQGNVFNGEKHGMYVLSTMAGILPAKLIGTAPEANYFLVHTEIGWSENLIEEDAWVAGIEWADSAGADVVNSSLGYSLFDDPSMNHTYSELNGRTAYASRAASMVASKGMILVNSAGNSGSTPWHYITVPSDARDILTVGAVDKNRQVATFSSRGPASDGRVKPDVMAYGVATVTASAADGEVTGVSGTSLAAPIITGLVACLWQEFPQSTSYEIMDAVRRSAHLYTIPNDSMGYGIPNFALARQVLSGRSFGAGDYIAEIFPNPFVQSFTLSFFTSEQQEVEVNLYDALGRIIDSRRMQAEAGNLNKIQLAQRQPLPQGIYFVSIRTQDKLLVKKIIRD